MNPRVSIHIVVWNSLVFLPDLLESVMNQTWRDFSVLVIDNASSDGAESFLKEKYPSVRYLRNARNLGFCVAHNQGIRYALEHWGEEGMDDHFILVANPDTLLAPTFLEECVKSMMDKPAAGAMGGKLLRAYGEGAGDETLKETVRSDRIDSVGLSFHKDYTFSECGAGHMNEGQFENGAEVFGVSDALVLYRASALQSVRFRDEFFDQDFFAYQEDIDLAFRLRYAGWQAWYEPRAVAYHYRGKYGHERKGLWASMKEYKMQSHLRRYLSTRNHWLLLMKNMDVISLVLLFPRWIISEVGRFVFLLFLKPSNVKAVFDALRLAPRMWQKRRACLREKKVSGRVIRKRFARAKKKCDILEATN